MTINSRDKRDVYYFMAKQNNYRARSIFKLKQIDEKYNVFNDTDINVLDLCAAPGSWSQYLSELKANRKNINNIIAVDLQDMMPIEGVTIYKDDITNEQFIKKLSNMQINRVICDGAPDVTGFYELDFILCVIYYTRLCFFMCTSIMLIISIFLFVFNSV